MTKLPTLKVNTGWIELTVNGEPNVAITFKGYAPVLPVSVNQTGLDYILYIAAKSLAEALEPLRITNNGLFSGLQFSIRKSSEDRFAPYEIKVDS
jgi:hypothetical protein